MIKINKKIKYFSFIFLGCSISLYSYNILKNKTSLIEIDMNNLNRLDDSEVKDKNIISKNRHKSYDDPFELIRNLDIENYFLDQITNVLYTPPLTNKLYPKSNLYGHELIRYFDK